MKLGQWKGVTTSALVASLIPAACIPPADAQVIEEIVVTASLRQESLQDVPMAISAFTGASLEDAGVMNYLDITRIAPNFSFTKLTGVGFATPTLRGVGATGTAESAISTAPPIGVYIDGVYMGSVVANLFDVIDVERVEVLRGPQGTLYGRNTLAGVVNIISKKPTNDFTARTKVGYGNYGRLEARGAVSGPIVEDILLARFGATYIERDGYVKNTFSNPNPAFNESDADPEPLKSVTLRGMLDWYATDTVSLSFAADYSHVESTFIGYQVEDGALFPFYGLGDYTGEDGIRRGAYNEFNHEETTNYGASLTGEFLINDAMRLVSITGYRDSRFLSPHYDLDATPFSVYSQYIEVKEDNLSQEFRLHYDTPRASFIAGIYYYESKKQQDIVDDFGGYLRQAGGSALLLRRDLGIGRVDSWAGFGNVDWHVTDKFTASFGARYTDSRRRFERRFRRHEDGGQFYDGSVAHDDVPPSYITAYDPAYPVFGRRSFNKLTPRVALKYAFTDDLMGYVSYSEGYRDGGFETRGTTDTEGFDAETLTAYETGLKTTVFDGRLQLNLAAYYYKYDDQQVEQSRLLPEGGLIISVENAAASNAYGFEAEFVAKPTDALTISGNLGLQRTEFDTFTAIDPSTLLPIDYAGNEFPLAPKLSSLLAIEYAWPLPSLGELRVRGEWAHRDGAWQTFQNDPLLRVEKHNLFNANASLLLNDNWRLSIWGRNLADEQYVSRAADFRPFFGYIARQYGEPRTFGVSVERTF